MDRVAGAPLSTPDRLDRPFADPLVERLFPPLATGVDWGLERTVDALEALGDPHRAYPTIHIGGTNGKGSVASTLAAVLNASGLKAACYTSPHLCSFRERILVDGLPLTEDEILARAEEVYPPRCRHVNVSALARAEEMNQKCIQSISRCIGSVSEVHQKCIRSASGMYQHA